MLAASHSFRQLQLLTREGLLVILSTQSHRVACVCWVKRWCAESELSPACNTQKRDRCRICTARVSFSHMRTAVASHLLNVLLCAAPCCFYHRMRSVCGACR